MAGAKSTEPTAAAGEAALENAATTGEKPPAKHRMPTSHVKWILSKKPMVPPARFAALKRSNPDLTPRPGEEEADEELTRLYFLAKAFYEMEERMPRQQERVRAELAEGGARTQSMWVQFFITGRENASCSCLWGYVEVDDEWMKQRAEAHAVFDREWPKIQAKLDAMILEDEEYARQQRASKASTRTAAAPMRRRKMTR
ncbi:hypothetical protein EJB05_54041, partial [Eragrostis curvula]